MIEEKSFSKNKISNIIEVVSGDIITLSKNKKMHIDAIVNAAKPTLMGGSGVDGAIHAEMDRILGKRKGLITFNEKIIQELEKKHGMQDVKGKDGGVIHENRIRCNPGQAVKTSGDKEFVKYIIHAVGPKYDGGSECIRNLQECYKSIMKIIFDSSDIQRVTIPIIGSGNYGFPMGLAFRIALTTIGNQLIECKHRNCDAYSNIKKIYLVIYGERSAENETVQKIYRENQRLIEKEERMVSVGSLEAQRSYVAEIWKFDKERRYYFTITKMMRLLLVVARFVFFPTLLLRHWAGKRGWRFRREIIEVETIFAAIFPALMVFILMMLQRWQPGIIEASGWILGIMCALCAYIMADTITYLLSLVFLADIQRPSANQLRSFILLCFNYIEMILGTAVFIYCYCWRRVTFWGAVDYSMFGNIYSIEGYDGVLRTIAYMKTGIDFIFLVLAFAFIVGQLKQRRFLSDY